MYSNLEKKIPIGKALGYVFVSVVLFWGGLWLGRFLHRELLQKRQTDPRYKVVALVQSCPQRERLKCWQLAELLELSQDEAPNLYSFDPKAGCNKLMRCPVIKSATCRRQKPGIVHVDYTLREPKVLLADFDNVALDQEGYAFPLQPYFTPKKLPELSVGCEAISYGQLINSKEATLAFSILNYLQSHFPKYVHPLRIDTRNAYAPSAGTQEVVLTLGPQIVRLPPKQYEKTLAAYIALQPTFQILQQDKAGLIIDLRSPNIALVKAI